MMLFLGSDDKSGGNCFSGRSALNFEFPATIAAPFACHVFSEDELNKRIEYYRQRAEQYIPLFHDGPPDRAKCESVYQRYVECCGCGLQCYRKLVFRDHGWKYYSRKNGHQSNAFAARYYCPKCPPGKPPYPGARLIIVRQTAASKNSNKILEFLRKNGPCREDVIGRGIGVEPARAADKLRVPLTDLLAKGIITIQKTPIGIGRRFIRVYALAEFKEVAQ